jgi:hypothetical protein
MTNANDCEPSPVKQGDLRHKIRPDLLTPYWDDLLRLAASLRHGWAPAWSRPVGAVNSAPGRSTQLLRSRRAAGRRRNGYGFRVPGLVISPCARTGFIDHQGLRFDA